jgi:hypothetical protein
MYLMEGDISSSRGTSSAGVEKAGLSVNKAPVESFSSEVDSFITPVLEGLALYKLFNNRSYKQEKYPGRRDLFLFGGIPAAKRLEHLASTALYLFLRFWIL